MQIVSNDMIKYLPADILSKVISDKVKEIKEGKTLFARWCKSQTSDNSSYKTTQSKIAPSKSAKADFS